MKTAALVSCLLLSTAAGAAPLDDAALEARARAIHDKVDRARHPCRHSSRLCDGGDRSRRFHQGTGRSAEDARRGPRRGVFHRLHAARAADGGRLRRRRKIAFTRLSAIHRFTGAYPKEIGLAASAADARKIAKSGRKVAFIGMENSFPLGPEPTQADIDRLARAGRSLRRDHAFRAQSVRQLLQPEY